MKIKSMKTIRVVAAVIRQNGKIFATQRGYGEWKDGWEFPGGKIETGETPEAALKREIQEELDTEISVNALTRLNTIMRISICRWIAFGVKSLAANLS